MPPPHHVATAITGDFWSTLGPYLIVFCIGVCFVVFGYVRSKLGEASAGSSVSVIAGPEEFEMTSEKQPKPLK